MYLVVPYSNGPKWWWSASFIINKMSNRHFLVFFGAPRSYLNRWNEKITAIIFNLVCKEFLFKMGYLYLKRICFCGIKFSWVLKFFNFSSNKMVNSKSLWNLYAFNFARKRLKFACIKFCENGTNQHTSISNNNFFHSITRPKASNLRDFILR